MNFIFYWKYNEKIQRIWRNLWTRRPKPRLDCRDLQTPRQHLIKNRRLCSRDHRIKNKRRIDLQTIRFCLTERLFWDWVCTNRDRLIKMKFNCFYTLSALIHRLSSLSLYFSDAVFKPTFFHSSCRDFLFSPPSSKNDPESRSLCSCERRADFSSFSQTLSPLL